MLTENNAGPAALFCHINGCKGAGSTFAQPEQIKNPIVNLKETKEDI
ncbi:hypothetical protein [Chitinophaga lutea]|nr:hypothetical protein [Chitinophaga lutea]